MATINDYGGSIDLILQTKSIPVKITLPSEHGLTREEIANLLLRFQIAADSFSEERTKERK